MFQRSILAVLIAATLLSAADRFDYKVRNDFFAGFSGDNEAFARAMKTAEEVIAANPGQEAEALAWHGSGLLVMAGQKFQQGDAQSGGEMWMKGNAEMDRAGKIAPDSVGVLVPRAAVWFAASRNLPKERATPLIEKAVADYEHVYEMQKSGFDALPVHNRSELLFGLADGYARLEKAEKARAYFTQLAAIGKSSGHLAQAEAYLAGTKYQVTGAGCVGCHTGK